MANTKKVGLEVIVSATDRATAKFKEINKGLSKSGLGKLSNSLFKLKGASGIAQMGKAMSNFGSSVANVSNEFSGLIFKVGALAGLGGGGLFALSKGFADFADNAQDSSERLGIGVESFQKLNIGAMLAGIDSEKFGNIINKFSRGLGDAALNGGEAAKVFQRLKISLKANGKSRTLDEILPEVAAKLNAMPNAFKRNAITAKLFGKNFGEITPYLRDFARYTKEAEGFIISKEDVERGDQFKDQIVTFGKILGSLSNVAGASMLGGFSEGLKVLSDFLMASKPQIKEFFKTIGKSLPDAFRALTSALKSTMQFFTTYDSKTGESQLNMGRLKLVFGAFAAFLAAPFLVALYGAATAFGALALSITSVGIAFGVAFPWLGLIAALGFTLYKNWEPFMELLSTIADKISSVVNFKVPSFMQNGVFTNAGLAAPANNSFVGAAGQTNTNNATASLTVNLPNLPKGARVSQSSTGFEDFLVSRGYAMQPGGY